MFGNCLKTIKIETCRSYDKLCVRNIILRLVPFLVLLCELKLHVWDGLCLRNFQSHFRYNRLRFSKVGVTCRHTVSRARAREHTQAHTHTYTHRMVIE